MPINTKSENVNNKESGMKPRKKGMKYKSPKKGTSKGLIAAGSGGVAIAIISALLLLPNNNSNNNKTEDSTKKLNNNSKYLVTCDFYYNENNDNIWIPNQEFHYEFLFNEKEDTIEKIHLSENIKHNSGSDEEIKSTYYSGCETCNVSVGVMTSESDMTQEEFMGSSNLRNDENKSLMNNLVETFNNTKSCEEGYYAYIPYIDTQAEYCPIENYRSKCTVKDVK